jgi:small-conductance mechanosensitive channel
MDFNEFVSRALNALEQAWNFELFRSGDHGVELNQVIVALVIILFGLLVSKRLARLVATRLSRFKRIDVNAVYLVQKLLYYLLVIIIAFIALPMAGIPIAALTVLGGAFAIGIGFGAQNTFNNLISGLILMMERPIRIGDIVEVEGEEGRIDDIGNRCVRVRRTDGVDVLVPNSFFIEEKVVNWTLHDSDVRGEVAVGVAYGSPVETVRDLLTRAAAEEEQVHETPAPAVLFEDFGDNALVFRLYFWCHVTRPIDLRQIQSDLRFRIDALCREHDITIAFPQRDVHVDSLGPLDVRVTRSGD